MQAIVNGLRTNYELSGSGKLIVMIHGWGSDIGSFTGLQRELSKTYQVLSLDLPGMGGTDKPEDTWHIDDFANFIEDSLRKIGLKNPYAIIGHSNGGAIAIKMIAKDLVSPKRLVLLASSGVRNTQNAKKKTLGTIAKIGKKSVFILPKKYQSKIKSKLYSTIGSEGLLLPELEQTFRNVVNEDIQDMAKTIETPTLLIYGQNDTSTPPEYGEVLSNNIPKSRLEIVEGAGHFVQLDQPSITRGLIERFLA